MMPDNGDNRSVRSFDLVPLISRLKIQRKDAKIVRLTPNWAQQEFLQVAADQMAATGRVRIITLKARQLGLSTISQALLFQLAFLTREYSGLVIAHEVPASQNLLKMTHRYWDNYDLKRLYTPKHLSKNDIGWVETGSNIKISTAGNKAAGRSATIHYLHACLAPGTPVITGDGHITPVENVEVGSKVVTHDGHDATVVAVTEFPGGEAVTVTPWLGEPITLTTNHKVFTARGWVEAGELIPTDELSMPVRAITHELTGTTLTHVGRADGSGVRRSYEGPLDYTRETGFAVGYYLAEGCITFNRSPLNGARQPAAVTFSRHRDETGYGDRAYNALAHCVSSRSIADRTNSLAQVEYLYGASLARWVHENFGHKETKRLPDWVFNAGVEFCTGIVEGYLSGDGSKTESLINNKYVGARVTATTVRSSIATQIRDLVASLGYGWGAITTKPAGNRYGRNCQQAWTVSWSGQAGRSLRALLGGPVNYGEGRPRTEKSRIADGRVWFKIRDITPTTLDTCWDLAVDHPDHSYRTQSFAVSNSEMAFWPEPETTFLGLRQTVPSEPGTVIVVESTANGVGNFFHTMWEDAVSGDSEFVPLFFPWWRHYEYRASHINLPIRHITDLDAEEKTLRKLGLDDDQLTWRRWAIRELAQSDVRLFDQEYPSTPEHAFLSSGTNIFPDAQLRDVYEPIQGYRGYLMRDGLDMTFQPSPNGSLTVYKAPSRDTDFGQYLVAGDPTHTTRGDYAVAQVINRRNMEQVAVWRGRVDPASFGEELFKLGMYYNTALVVSEIEGPGYATIGKLLGMNYPRVYRKARPDHTPGKVSGDLHGWSTTMQSKHLAIGWLLKAVVDGSLTLHHPGTYTEMKNYVSLESGGYGNGDGSDHDDTVMAMAMAVTCHMLDGPIMAYGQNPPETYEDYDEDWEQVNQYLTQGGH